MVIFNCFAESFLFHFKFIIICHSGQWGPLPLVTTFIENCLHFMKNCIRPHYEKLKPLKSGFIENSIFENNRDPWVWFSTGTLVNQSENFAYYLFGRNNGFFWNTSSLWTQGAKPNQTAVEANGKSPPTHVDLVDRLHPATSTAAQFTHFTQQLIFVH